MIILTTSPTCILSRYESLIKYLNGKNAPEKEFELALKGKGESMLSCGNFSLRLKNVKSQALIGLLPSSPVKGSLSSNPSELPSIKLCQL